MDPESTQITKDALRSFSEAGPPAKDFPSSIQLSFTHQTTMHYAYLIESVSAKGERYVGYTQNLNQRMANHNAGKNSSTAAHRPWKLNTCLAFSGKPQAMTFERYLKSGSGHAFARKRLW